VRHEAATQVGFVELVEVVRVEELVLKNKMKFWMFLKKYCVCYTYISFTIRGAFFLELGIIIESWL
jgi:hypothetical protein